MDAVKKQAEVRVAGLEKEMEKALEHWVLAPVVEALSGIAWHQADYGDDGDGGAWGYHPI